MSHPTTGPPRNGFGITALVLALVGLVFGLVPLTGFIALILGALAVFFGLLGWARARRGEATNLKMSVISTLLGVGVAVLGLVSISITFSASDQLGKDLENVGNDPAALSEVTASDCSVTEEFGTRFSRATVTITNSTDATRSYAAMIRVYDSSGTRVGEIKVFSEPLAAGQSATLSGADSTGNATSNAQPGPVTCVVASVNWF